MTRIGRIRHAIDDRHRPRIHSSVSSREHVAAATAGTSRAAASRIGRPRVPDGVSPVRRALCCGPTAHGRRRGRLHDDGTHRGSPAPRRPGPRLRRPAPPPAAPAAAAGGTGRPRRPQRRRRVPDSAGGAEAGPAPGIAYAELVDRIVALIIDAIMLGIVGFVRRASPSARSSSPHRRRARSIFAVSLGGLVSAPRSAPSTSSTAGRRMRASLGQKILGLETVSATDGATLTQRRPSAAGCSCTAGVAQALQSRGIIPIVGLLVWPPGHRLRALPAVHDVPEPQAPGLPRRPGQNGRRSSAPA